MLLVPSNSCPVLHFPKSKEEKRRKSLDPSFKNNVEQFKKSLNSPKERPNLTEPITQQEQEQQQPKSPSLHSPLRPFIGLEEEWDTPIISPPPMSPSLLWNEYQTDAGYQYYYNSLTQNSQWTIPSPLYRRQCEHLEFLRDLLYNEPLDYERFRDYIERLHNPTSLLPRMLENERKILLQIAIENGLLLHTKLLAEYATQNREQYTMESIYKSLIQAPSFIQINLLFILEQYHLIDNSSSHHNLMIECIRAKQHPLLLALFTMGLVKLEERTYEGIFLAINLQDMESLQILLQYGTNPLERDVSGMSPLDLCLKTKYIRGAQIVQYYMAKYKYGKAITEKGLISEIQDCLVLINIENCIDEEKRNLMIEQCKYVNGKLERAKLNQLFQPKKNEKDENNNQSIQTSLNVLSKQLEACQEKLETLCNSTMQKQEVTEKKEKEIVVMEKVVKEEAKETIVSTKGLEKMESSRRLREKAKERFGLALSIQVPMEGGALSTKTLSPEMNNNRIEHHREEEEGVMMEKPTIEMDQPIVETYGDKSLLIDEQQRLPEPSEIEINPQDFFFQSIRESNTEQLLSLLGNGYPIDQANEKQQTGLHIACELGNDLMVSILCEYDAPLDVMDEDQNTPLHIASVMGHYKCIQILLQSAVNPNMENFHGDTPLHMAAVAGHNNCIRLLLEYGADKTKKNKRGMRPYDTVIRRSPRRSPIPREIARELLDLLDPEIQVPTEMSSPEIIEKSFEDQIIQKSFEEQSPSESSPLPSSSPPPPPSKDFPPSKRQTWSEWLSKASIFLSTKSVANSTETSIGEPQDSPPLRPPTDAEADALLTINSPPLHPPKEVQEALRRYSDTGNNTVSPSEKIIADLKQGSLTQKHINHYKHSITNQTDVRSRYVNTFDMSSQ